MDERLEGEGRDGLDELLANAPIGFAIQAAIGWIVHATVKPSLQLYRITDQDGTETFVIAPNADIASALYVNCLPVSERVGRRFDTTNGVSSLPAERAAGVTELLEFGPIGICEWRDSRWQVQ